MIDDEHLLVSFNEHYNNIPRVLLVLSESDYSFCIPKGIQIKVLVTKMECSDPFVLEGLITGNALVRFIHGRKCVPLF